ncbi:MAG: 4-(cytidine 5'-diphospho)-2-C-methyl-D-erythritol kinase [Kiritimatiellae bacterium]|nr:4-(cytidine 5'-diphospho)-2-C-methyl-D-erythritol kinase [Kiritimatiellia bacterium]
MYARAKINLTLEVLGVRTDGFHDIRSLVVPISLADEIELRPADGISLDVAVAPDAASPGSLDRLCPAGENLAVKAAELLRREAGHAGGVAISLLKRIPSGAGLGGGSADAAAVLAGLNGLWGLGLSRERLSELGAGLGSDVPALVLGGPVLMEGRGERVRREASGAVVNLVLVFPGVFASTSAVYAKCVPQLTDGRQILDNMRHALSGGGAEAVAAALHNGLSPAAEALHPEIAQARAALLAAGACGASMTGSGSCVFGVMRDADHARMVAADLAQAGYEARPAHTCPVM